MTASIFKIAIFSFLLNVSIAITMLMFPAMAGNTGGLFYDQNMTQGYIVGLNGSLQTSTIAESTATDFFMDSIIVNSIVKFTNAVKLSFFALPVYFKSTLGIYMDPDLSTTIYNIMYGVLLVLYSVGVLSLFTGKDLIGGGN